ncbi:MAG: polysaccharide pyruvyl transferase family protein [Tissierellia bacterium]|jgi:polysaccharide pyruvyl transferase WcaK-like protein|nr:polysaccharide pyruvyl transferase family protein [Tissierellia bacterium]
MNKRFLLYGHGGSYNHGAEAIVKCTVDMIKERYPDSKIILSTHFKEQDIEFSMPIDEYCQRDMKYVEMDKNSIKKGNLDNLIYKSTLEQITEDTICLSVGGDNYCYDNWRKWKAIHERAIETGARSILWSCSIEPAMIDDEMLDVLKSHHLITARESITYNVLKDRGLDNIRLCSDIAFLMKPKECSLPENFLIGNTVAINISPLIIRREKTEGIVLRNIEKLMDLIISSTDMNIVLIPHVLMPMDNDLEILEKIFNRLENKERICFVNKNISAAEYKYIISNCRLGVFARTHASIAAYSTCVPSMVIGYSVKSKGIAKDLGLEDFVSPIKEFHNDYCIISMFEELMNNEQNIKKILADKIPSYKKRAMADF